MHISEGLLPVAHAVAWSIAAIPFTVRSSHQLAAEMRKSPQDRVRIVAASAFIVTLSALKLPSLTGSCSHPTGIGLGVLLVGPKLMPAISTAVLLFQCLILAHGGLSTLGANVLSMGVAGAAAAWLAGKAFGHGKPGRFAVGLAGSLAPYLVASMQLALAHPVQNDVIGSFTRFAAILSLTQVPLAISEGIFTMYAARWFAVAEPKGALHATS
ncbi:MAG TPA: energy-coupling factor ABC transporter permease [Bryobacteraceae bacterium]|jgi:cobalt/nickel transport system permease protein|nr:energy-coupling factor ABC transporter permease [Bryobacteraceae bacterium]